MDSSISNDSNTINRQVSELQESQKAWNQNIHSYKALVSYYYGRQTLDNFVDSIYIPFIELGNYALARKTYNDKAWIADQSARLNENIQAFADEIYKLALE